MASDLEQLEQKIKQQEIRNEKLMSEFKEFKEKYECEKKEFKEKIDELEFKNRILEGLMTYKITDIKQLDNINKILKDSKKNNTLCETEVEEKEDEIKERVKAAIKELLHKIFVSEVIKNISLKETKKTKEQTKHNITTSTFFIYLKEILEFDPFKFTKKEAREIVHSAIKECRNECSNRATSIYKLFHF